ncbi:hypothetical protein DTO012A8_8508 [Penicillium roqueforti]|nr:hypothetical protein DTO012A8_8508 [Penicillium roqueforti]
MLRSFNDVLAYGTERGINRSLLSAESTNLLDDEALPSQYLQLNTREYGKRWEVRSDFKRCSPTQLSFDQSHSFIMTLVLQRGYTITAAPIHH